MKLPLITFPVAPAPSMIMPLYVKRLITNPLIVLFFALIVKPSALPALAPFY
jgi:hypothetical protein